MTWLRLDDDFARHPKILALTPTQRWTWVETLCWAATYSEATGLLPDTANRAVPGLAKLRPRLRDLRLLDTAPDGTDEIHDWILYTGASIDQKVAFYLERHEESSANDVWKAIGGNRSAVLKSVSDYRTTQASQPRTGSGEGGTNPGSAEPANRFRDRFQSGTESGTGSARTRGATRPDPLLETTPLSPTNAGETTPATPDTATRERDDQLWNLLQKIGCSQHDLDQARTDPTRALATAHAAINDPKIEKKRSWYRKVWSSGEYPENADHIDQRQTLPLYHQLTAWIRNAGHHDTEHGVTEEIRRRETTRGETLTDEQRLELHELWLDLQNPTTTPHPDPEPTTGIPTLALRTIDAAPGGDAAGEAA